MESCEKKDGVHKLRRLSVCVCMCVFKWAREVKGVSNQCVCVCVIMSNVFGVCCYSSETKKKNRILFSSVLKHMRGGEKKQEYSNAKTLRIFVYIYIK